MTLPRSAAALVVAASMFLSVGCAAPEPAKTAAPGDASTAAGAAASPAPAGDAGAAPSEAKPWLGLDVKPVGPWTPTWEAGATTVKWEAKGVFAAVKVRLFKSKLDSIDDLKKEAPMMSEIGSDVTKVVDGPKTTPKGWYAVVESNEGKSRELVYVQRLGGQQLLCSAALKLPDLGADDVPKLEVALAACESIQAK